MAVISSEEPHVYSSVDNIVIIAGSVLRQNVEMEIEQALPRVLAEITQQIFDEHPLEKARGELTESDIQGLYTIGELMVG